MRCITVLALIAVLTGCGHSQISYTPSPRQGMTQHQAASIVEQGFYEDYSRQKPQSAMVTDAFIALSNGSVTRGLTTGTASFYGGVAIGLGSTFLRTEEITQRIYLRSLGVPVLSKRNGRDNRFAVTIRMTEGTTARSVYFRSEERADEFADALVYLRNASSRGQLRQGAPQQPATVTSADLDKKAWQDQQIKKLQESDVSYEDYQVRYKKIMGE